MNKGIDDLLVGGGQPDVLKGDDVRQEISRIRRQAETADPPRPWKPLRPFTETGTLPEFPKAVLRGPLNAFVEAVAEAMQVPVMMPALLTLATVSAVVQKKFVVEVKEGYAEPTNLYVLVGMPPSSLKTPVVRAVVAPLRLWEARQRQLMSGEVAAARARKAAEEQRLKNLQDQVGREQDDAKRTALLDAVAEQARRVESFCEVRVPRLLADNFTPEALVTLMVENDGRMAILSAESDLFEILGGRYTKGSPNMGVVLNAHGGDDITVDRKGRPPETVKEPALAIGLAVQPSVVKDLVSNRAFTQRGLTAKFLYAIPGPLRGRRNMDAESVPPAVREAYNTTITALLEVPWKVISGEKVPYKFDLSAEAKQVWRDWAADVESRIGLDGPWEGIAEWAGKLVGTTVRIAGLLHLAEHANGILENLVIDEDTMLSAVEVVVPLVDHAMAVLTPNGGLAIERDANYVLGVIRRKEKLRFNRSELWQWVKGKYSSMAQLDAVIEDLVDRNYLRPVERRGTRKAGRPANLFEVSPQILGVAHTDADQDNGDDEECDT